MNLEDAACRDHPAADLWSTETGTSPAAKEAKAICRDCPERKQCGTDAVRRGETRGIYGGFHVQDDWTDLHIFLGLPLPVRARVNTMRTCACGREYHAPQGTVATSCLSCRNDTVPAGPVLARVLELAGEGRTMQQVAEYLGINRSLVSRIVNGAENVKRSTAEKILGHEIARAS